MAEWHKGPSIIVAPMASVLAECRVAPGRSPKLLLPPNKSSRHSEVPRLPSLEKSQDSTCLNQPMAPRQGMVEDTSPHSAPLWQQWEGFSSSTLSVPGLSPFEGRRWVG